MLALIEIVHTDDATQHTTFVEVGCFALVMETLQNQSIDVNWQMGKMSWPWKPKPSLQLHLALLSVETRKGNSKTHSKKNIYSGIITNRRSNRCCFQ